MQRVLGLAALCFAVAVSGWAADTDTITALDHLKAVNKVMCEKAVKAKPGKTQAQCEKELNAMSELNPANKTSHYPLAKSQACVKAMQAPDVTVDNMMEKSISGACAVDKLK
jgi:hypothetical protein